MKKIIKFLDSLPIGAVQVMYWSSIAIVATLWLLSVTGVIK